MAVYLPENLDAFEQLPDAVLGVGGDRMRSRQRETKANSRSRHVTILSANCKGIALCTILSREQQSVGLHARMTAVILSGY